MKDLAAHLARLGDGAPVSFNHLGRSFEGGVDDGWTWLKGWSPSGRTFMSASRGVGEKQAKDAFAVLELQFEDEA